MSHCPNNCITNERFVINVGRCLSLFNEVAGEFPEWISAHAHNALIGCMRCQMYCPANREYIRLTGRLEAITENETQRILNGTADEKLLTSLSKKLRNFGPASSQETFPIFTRNLRVLMNERNDMSD
jgi:epoxyqueuosine reductase